MKMAAGSDMFLETVSLNDDDVANNNNNNTHNGSVDHLEAQLPVYSNGHSGSIKAGKAASVPHPIMEDDDDDANDDVISVEVVVVESGNKPLEKLRPSPPSLPPLRVMQLSKLYGKDDDDGDYVDPTLFSPEVSRHAMDQAHRRARKLEGELKELAALEPTITATAVKITPLEAVHVISGAFVSSLLRVKHMVTGHETEYDLLQGSSPSSKVDDLDTDGDGLQLSPDASKGDGKHFQASKLKPALKRLSAYSNIATSTKSTQAKPQRRIMWNDEVLDQDEELVDDDEDDDNESEALMVNGNSAIAKRQATPRSKKKRKKLVRSVMRRLTPREKEELYRLRPDLMIVPNWAQKYREEMTEADSTRWSFWIISIIGTLLILLVILIVLIARDKAAGVSSSK